MFRFVLSLVLFAAFALAIPQADANGGRGFFVQPFVVQPQPLVLQQQVLVQPYVQQQVVPALGLLSAGFLGSPFVGVGIGNRFLGIGNTRGIRSNFVRGVGVGRRFIR